MDAESCETAGLRNLVDVEECTVALQTLVFNQTSQTNPAVNELFEIDSVNTITRPPACSFGKNVGPLPQYFLPKGYWNADFTSPRRFAARAAAYIDPAYPGLNFAIGHCTGQQACLCGTQRPPCQPRPRSLPYVRVESGTCRSNGYEDYLDMSQCVQVLAENYYRHPDTNAKIAFGIHPVTGNIEPPGCWPVDPLALQLDPNNLPGDGPEACISMDYTEPRLPPVGYCSPRIPCYCKP